MQTLQFTQPDDFHVHLRDGDALKVTVPHVARQFSRAIVMPNLVEPVVNVALAQAYKERIKAHIPKNNNFKPLMTLYLTESTTVQDIEQVKNTDFIYALKYYPKGATTHSNFGVFNWQKLIPVFKKMAELDILLLIHGEVVDETIDIFQREAMFIETILKNIIHQVPDLKIVLEHITTEEAVNFVKNAPDNIAATITAHHLFLNRNHLLVGGIKPHYYCLPILKTSSDQQALINAATSGNPKFFLGTDSAPHAQHKKESACGCAGVYTAHAAIELYAELFNQQGKLKRLPDFAAKFGARFYGLPENTRQITLQQKTWQIPDFYPYLNTKLIPFWANQSLNWQL